MRRWSFKLFGYVVIIELTRRVAGIYIPQNSVDDETRRMEALRVSQDTANPRPRPSK